MAYFLFIHSGFSRNRSISQTVWVQFVAKQSIVFFSQKQEDIMNLRVAILFTQITSVENVSCNSWRGLSSSRRAAHVSSLVHRKSVQKLV